MEKTRILLITGGSIYWVKEFESRLRKADIYLKLSDCEFVCERHPDNPFLACIPFDFIVFDGEWNDISFKFACGQIISKDELLSKYVNVMNADTVKIAYPFSGTESDLIETIACRKKKKDFKFFDPELIKHCTVSKDWCNVYEEFIKKMKGIKAMPTIEIKKVILSGPKTIVIFSDEKKVVLTAGWEVTVDCGLFNKLMLAAIKRKATSKQWSFFCDHCDPTIEDMKSFVKACFDDPNFWPTWERYIKYIMHELPSKEEKKMFVYQAGKTKIYAGRGEEEVIEED